MNIVDKILDEFYEEVEKTFHETKKFLEWSGKSTYELLFFRGCGYASDAIESYLRMLGSREKDRKKLRKEIIKSVNAFIRDIKKVEQSLKRVKSMLGNAPDVEEAVPFPFIKGAIFFASETKRRLLKALK